MEILIVDDEESTRQALREVLAELGHNPIHEAAHGEEALQLIANEKHRIRMIVADWEMPHMDGITLADRVAEIPEMNLIPFLLITSDLPHARLNEIKNHHKRIDHALFKPFRAKILEESIQQAYANRVSRRDALIWLGASQPVAGISAVIQEQKESFLFRRVLKEHDGQGFSVVIMDTDRPTKDLDAVVELKKSLYGSSAVWVALGRDPERILPFREFSHIFSDSASVLRVEDWSQLLRSLNERIKNGWQTEVLSLEAQALVRQKHEGKAKKLLEKALTLDRLNPGWHVQLADVLIRLGELEKASSHELAALKLNPCLAEPYVRLFETLPRSNIAKIAELAERAAVFCPQNAQVLSVAADALKASGHPEGARKLNERVKKIV